MKKFIVGLAILSVLFAVGVSLAGTAANSYIGGYAPWVKPCNLTIYKLDSANYKGDDSIGATYSNYYGPFALASDGTVPQFKFMRCLVPKGTFTAACTVSVEYQILSGSNVSDTGVSKFVAFDSIKSGAGSSGTVVKIDSLVGASIIFKMKCLANSATAVFLKPVKILLQNYAIEAPDTKH
jgi:hypothetical protein